MTEQSVYRFSILGFASVIETDNRDYKRGIDTNMIRQTEKFYAPIEKTQNGAYKMKSGQTVYVCFSSDFLIEDADQWRTECWKMIRERSDLHFLFLTKRIERFSDCISGLAFLSDSPPTTTNSISCKYAERLMFSINGWQMIFLCLMGRLEKILNR